MVANLFRNIKNIIKEYKKVIIAGAVAGSLYAAVGIVLLMFGGSVIDKGLKGDAAIIGSLLIIIGLLPTYIIDTCYIIDILIVVLSHAFLASLIFLTIASALKKTLDNKITIDSSIKDVAGSESISTVFLVALALLSALLTSYFIAYYSHGSIGFFFGVVIIMTLYIGIPALITNIAILAKRRISRVKPTLTFRLFISFVIAFMFCLQALSIPIGRLLCNFGMNEVEVALKYDLPTDNISFAKPLDCFTVEAIQGEAGYTYEISCACNDKNPRVRRLSIAKTSIYYVAQEIYNIIPDNYDVRKGFVQRNVLEGVKYDYDEIAIYVSTDADMEDMRQLPLEIRIVTIKHSSNDDEFISEYDIDRLYIPLQHLLDTKHLRIYLRKPRDFKVWPEAETKIRELFNLY